MTPAEFAAKWSRTELPERASAQEHFLDLCTLVGHPKPAEADPTGESFCFERGATKHGGGDGWADVWKRGHFAFEYKGRHKNLARAYDQLLLYRESLENPPLLVVCDTCILEIHTNFTGTKKIVHVLTLEQLRDTPEKALDLLRTVFHEPEKLRPTVSVRVVTEDAAARFGRIADSLRSRGVEPQTAAHFLDRLVFCLFAEDVGLLPASVFSQIVEHSRFDPPRFRRQVDQLFSAMARGGDFGAEEIRHFNGDLFNDAPAIDLTEEEIAGVRDAAALDWRAIDPSIFGTLFERGLDPAKRAQLGAHYTSREDIDLLIEPVVLAPLRAEWTGVRTVIDNLVHTGNKTGRAPAASQSAAVRKKALREADQLKDRFLDRLGRVTVLDPACGSGNFLYVTLQRLLDLEKEVMLHGGNEGLNTAHLPRVAPWHFYGLELSPYAHDLAQMTLWIGYLQWKHGNGYALLDSPLLRKMPGFQCRDAILDRTDPSAPREPEWPAAEFIVGNPPFLGGKMLRRELGDDYVTALHTVWRDRVPAEADLCCYWFEQARAQIVAGRTKRAGLLATQGIRGGANRGVLTRIKETGDIFFAVSDREWILDGAAVHISMVGFDRGGQTTRTLDGESVPAISANLTGGGADLTTARRLAENLGVGFMGDTKVGPFDLPESQAREMLDALNPHGRSNREVVRPWANGLDVTRAPRGMWIVDFPPGTTEAEAQLFDRPYQFILAGVKPMRATARSGDRTGIAWWIHQRPRPEMRAKLERLPRFLATARVAKHRLFVWLEHPTLPDCQIIAFARADDYFLGVLHSRFHELWSLAMGTQLRERESGFRYTPTTCFETFPFPFPMGSEAGESEGESESESEGESESERKEGGLAAPKPDGAKAGPIRAISAAAAQLHDYRSNWLGDRTDRKRTLTALYNARPEWLKAAHARLDAAVAAAYGWPANLPDAEVLARLLALNHSRPPAA